MKGKGETACSHSPSWPVVSRIWPDLGPLVIVAASTNYDDFIWFCCRESLCNHCYQRRRILTAIWAKEFLDRLWSTGNNASAKCFVQKCSWLFKMDHWILQSSQNWAKHTEVHRQLYPTSQPCVWKGLRTPVEMRIWKSEACGFTGVFLLSLFGKDFPIWLEGNVTNATMNHYLDSYLVVRCLGHFRFSFFEIQRTPPK